MARKILGWSDDEFWRATPRKLLFVYASHLEFLQKLSSIKSKPKILVGKEAITQLKQLANSVL